MTAEELAATREELAIAAMRAVFVRVNEGDIEIKHQPYQSDTPHDFKPYPSHLTAFAGYCVVCGSGDPHPAKQWLDCPEDDTCTCESMAAMRLLSNALNVLARVNEGDKRGAATAR